MEKKIARKPKDLERVPGEKDLFDQPYAGVPAWAKKLGDTMPAQGEKPGAWVDRLLKKSPDKKEKS